MQIFFTERNFNMWVPGFGTEDIRSSHRRSAMSESHKSRMALIRKTLKKYWNLENVETSFYFCRKSLAWILSVPGHEIWNIICTCCYFLLWCMSCWCPLSCWLPYSLRRHIERRFLLPVYEHWVISLRVIAISGVRRFLRIYFPKGMRMKIIYFWLLIWFCVVAKHKQQMHSLRRRDHESRYLQRSPLFCANLIKKDPGRAG